MTPKDRVHALAGTLNPNVSDILVHLTIDAAEVPAVTPPRGLTLRELGHRDVSGWNRLVARAYPDPGTPARGLADLVDGRGLFADLVSYGVFEGGRLVATFSLGPYVRAPEVLGGRRLAVDPRVQGRGIGRWTVAQTLTAQRWPGRIEMLVKSGRSTALRMYGRLGFQLCSEWSALVPTGQRRPAWARAAALRRAARAIGAPSVTAASPATAGSRATAGSGATDA